MDVLMLFFKIFFTGIFLVLLWFFSKKIGTSVFLFWNTKNNLILLKDLIHNDLYDIFTIKRALKYYIPPKVQDFHPGKKQKRGLLKKSDLTRKMDSFLDHDAAYRHLLILADSGMGKTAFALNYFIHNLRRPKKNRHTIVLVPLGFKKAEDLILAPSDKENSVLFLDGFDEDITAAQTRRNRIRQLIDLGQRYKRVIITSSPDFFPKDKTMRVKNGYERIGPENINESHYYEFRKLYLSCFDSAGIKKYTSSRFSIWEIGIKKRFRSFLKNTSIRRITPLLLNYSQEALQQGENIPSIYDLYEKIIAAWISREPNWLDKSMLDRFSQLLAADIYLGRKSRGMEAITQNELIKKATDWGIPLYSFENSVRSLINHSRTGLFKFAHRSIMEYLFIKRLISGDPSCYKIPLTHQMGLFLLEMLEEKNPENLKVEFNWLSQFQLMAHGMTINASIRDEIQTKDLFNTILRKNKHYDFLADLNLLIQNPIFYEFGWDSKLNENLNKAVYHSKPSLMKLSKKNWTVMINPTKIEITKRYEKNKTILINEKNLKEYSRLCDNALILKLSDAVGLKGLIMTSNINRSKNFCVLPDLKKPQRFTLCFWLNARN